MDILIEEEEGRIWVAALKNGRLDGLEVEPTHEEVRWGSIYWARVKSIDAALDAAFLDLDGFNTGILYNNDTRRTNEDGRVVKGGASAIGKSYKAGDMIAVQAKSAYIPKDYDDYARAETKTPQMSMDITLPGRYLIYCPMMEINRVSTRIRDKKMRKQLLKMQDELEDINGCILRLAAANTQTDVLMREGKILYSAWSEMQEYMNGSDPGLIALGPDAIQRTLSDQAAQRIERIEVVTMEHFEEVEEWCGIFAPDLVTKIAPIELANAEEDLALFHERDILGQIEDLFQSYCVLPSGGSVIMQGTAALTAVDVNKGSDKDSKLGTNVEAAKEIARQLRLRNCGGIIVIDFLKMNSKKEQGKLIAALEEAINDDPCTVQIHGLTNLGLIEMTRKRRTPPLDERFIGKFE
ncbi:MAG: ribonuclease E [Alphaproteobacteria bacterium]|nr:ribonuclease E [Alphaproteobacteria bacterium]